MSVLLLGSVFPSVLEGSGKLRPEDWICFLNEGSLGGVGTGGKVGFLGIDPVVYEGTPNISVVSTQSKGRVIAGWVRLLSA